MATRRRGSSRAHRRFWSSIYEGRSYRDLPWFMARPSDEVVDAVRAGFFPPRSEVLDIGCGAGSNVLYLARRGYRAHGVDISPRAIEAARARARKEGLDVDVREGDALALPYARGRFRAVNDRGCFHTIPIARRKEYGSEVARVLRPGGALLVAWVGREQTTRFGPPHRPSVEDVTRALEKWFIFRRVEFHPADGKGRFAGYVAHLSRRVRPQPPPR